MKQLYEVLRLGWHCVRERRVPWRIKRIWKENHKLSAVLAWIEESPAGRALASRTRRKHAVLGLRSRPRVRHWQAAPPCPRALYDAGGAQVGNRLFVVRGYHNLGEVNDQIFVFDMLAEDWVETIDPPRRLAHSHAAICSDGSRYIYAASGQLGSQCHPAIADCLTYDTVLRTWSDLPALPEPRYAGTMQLLEGRLHFVGGALPDRYTAASDHWSLAVRDGLAVETAWRKETPIPLPAMHRGSVVIDGAFYVLGGQQGDFVAIHGDPNCTCTGRTRELYFAHVYRYRAGDSHWSRLRDMPIPASHTDFSVVYADGHLHVIGGQSYKDPVNFRLRLTDAIQSYNLAEDRWRIAGNYPYRIKLPVCGLHLGALFCSTGQRDQSSTNDSPGSIVDDTWRVELSKLSSSESLHSAVSQLPSVHDKDIVFITHELSATGAPLLLLEAACAMRDNGARVRVFSLADDATYGNEAERHGIPVLPIEESVVWAARADLVIANTCESGPWIADFLARNPSAGARLLWWIHENSPEEFAQHLPGTEGVETVVFDSHAAQSAWVGYALGRQARRHVVHPGNRDELRIAASSDRITWSLAPSKGELDREEARRLLGLTPEDFVLCSIGTVIPRKGQQLLLDTVAWLLDQHADLKVKVLIVGFWSARQRRATLQALSQSARRAVLNGRLLLERCPDVRVFYRVADAFVMNSQGRGEPFGRVTIEAMAFGLPVLGTDAGGTAEIVMNEETGLLHPANTDGLGQLSSNILRLVRDPTLTRRLGAAGRERAGAYFTAQRQFADLQAILAPMLTPPPYANLGETANEPGNS